MQPPHHRLIIGLSLLLLTVACSFQSATQPAAVTTAQLGPRPFYLVDQMHESALKRQLEACARDTRVFQPSRFSIGHRGAPLQFPEHTRESYLAAVRMGAGIVECDVTFTRDRQLVCRHAQCDLHRTTNIVTTELAQACAIPPEFDADGALSNAAEIRCCTSDITLAQFKTLEGKMDAANLGPTIADLLQLEGGSIVPSAYARAAQRAGLDIIAWTTERSGQLHAGANDSYYRTVAGAIGNDGDIYTVMHALAQDVGVVGLFSDWPASTTFYANCAN